MQSQELPGRIRAMISHGPFPTQSLRSESIDKICTVAPQAVIKGRWMWFFLSLFCEFHLCVLANFAVWIIRKLGRSLGMKILARSCRHVLLAGKPQTSRSTLHPPLSQSAPQASPLQIAKVTSNLLAGKTLLRCPHYYCAFRSRLPLALSGPCGWEFNRGRQGHGRQLWPLLRFCFAFL